MDYKNATKDKSDIGSMITGISKNVLLSIVFTMTALLIFAFLITYTETDTSYISAIIIVITIASIILSAFLNGKKSSEKGWLTGVLSGFIYMLILYITGSIIFADFTVNSNAISMLFLGIVSGALGGIIGINNKKRYKR